MRDLRRLDPTDRLVREADHRVLEVIFDANGAAIVNERDISRQSVILTWNELRWLALRAPILFWRSWRQR